ncbi:UNVERIFIED_CONTAM: very-short-patch-repair endonuclease [Williamsia faeni]
MRAEELLAVMSRYQLRENYRILFRGVWVRADQVVDFTMLSFAAGLAYPGGDKDLPGILCGWSAADLWGNAYRPEGALPEVIVPINGRQFRGIKVRRLQIDENEYTGINGSLVTTLARTAIDLGRFNSRDDAVSALDSLARRHPGLLEDVRRALKWWERHWGIGKAITAFKLVDPLSESPWETRVRLILVDEGFHGFVLQHEVMGGRYRLDAAWPHLLVAVEYDGEHHRSSEQHARDLERWNRLRAAGWVVITVTAQNIRSGRDEFVEQLRRELTLRGWTPKPDAA